MDVRGQAKRLKFANLVISRGFREAKGILRAQQPFTFAVSRSALAGSSLTIR